MTIIEQIVDIPLVLKYLGEWNNKKHKIVLYDVPNVRANEIKKEIIKITDKFKFIIDSPRNDYTNINILDIDL